MKKDIETRIVVISPSSDVTPNQLISLASTYPETLQLKETCYGMIVQGERADISKVMDRLRYQYPYSIFIKERGYPLGDKRKCRSGIEGGLSGGPRPGFHQLEGECKALSNIGKALKAVDEGEPLGIGEEKGQLDEETIRRLVNKLMVVWIR